MSKGVGVMTKAEKLMLLGMYLAASADIVIAIGVWLLVF